MKLCNFLRYDPSCHGVGLRRGGKLEEQVWQEFAHRPEHIRKIAESICNNYNKSQKELEWDDEDEDQFPEGRILYKQHRYRERNKKLVYKAKEIAIKTGKLVCVVCGFDFYRKYGKVGEGFIECHHTVPVSEYSQNKTTNLKDIALVCSNCHRMLHRKRP